LIGIERLGDERVGSGFPRFSAVRLVGERGDDDRFRPRQIPLVAHVRDDVKARSGRHQDVDEDQIGPEAISRFYRFGDGSRLLEAVVAHQGDAHQVTQRGLVVTDQNAGGSGTPAHETSRNTSSSLAGFCWREVTVNVPRTPKYSLVPPTTASS